ncbi:methyltransferase domain-containing protein [Acidobacteriota bacterium]
MQYRTAALLTCPYDNHFPLNLKAFKETPVPAEILKPRALDCQDYCHLNNTAKIDSTDCRECRTRLIEEGVLFCPECRRLYPIRDHIASFLPDELRGEDDLSDLDLARLPEKMREAARGMTDKNAVVQEGVEDRLSEMNKRDEESDLYDKLYPRRASMAEIDLVLRELEPLPGEVILDAGCGTGRITTEILPRSGDLVGVDFSFESLRFLWNRTGEAERTKLHLVQADLSLLPLRKHSVDRALSISTICFLPTRDLRSASLKAIAGALRPGGVLVASVYNYAFMKKVLGFFRLSSVGKKEGYHSGGSIRYYNYDRQEYLDFLYDGFEVLNLTGSDHRLPLLSKIHPSLTAAIDRWLERRSLSIPIFAREMLATCRKGGEAITP